MNRKLMKLCIHDRCSAHWILDPDDDRGGEMCKGGEFVADDALIIENIGEVKERIAAVLRNELLPVHPRLVDAFLEAFTFLDALTVREGAG